MRTKKFGFTLAEVLITLGIIGVVAAMTIPTLISNTNSAKFKSQYKKTLSTLNQAALMGTAQYDLDYASITTACATGGNEKPDVTASMCALINGTLSGATYYATASALKVPGTSTAYSINGTAAVAKTDMVAYQLADGSVVAFDKNLKSCTLAPGDPITSSGLSSCRGFIDVNGPTLPNKEVQCGGGGTTAVASTVGDCVVRNNAADMGDIFPVVFHDVTVEPITNAARYVLNQSK